HLGLWIGQDIPIEGKLDDPRADEYSVNARKMLLDLAKRPSLKRLVEIPQSDLGEVSACWGRSRPHRQFLEPVLNDLLDIEHYGARDRLSECRCANLPVLGEPACGTFHAHAELGEAASIERDLGRPKCSGVVLLVDSRSVVTDDDAPALPRVPFDSDLDLEIFALDLLKGLAIVNKALD